MTIKEKKRVVGLKNYYEYLKARLWYVRAGFLDIDDLEFERINKTITKFKTAFTTNKGFKEWLLKKWEWYRVLDNETDEEREFYNIAENLINEILESEKNG